MTQHYEDMELSTQILIKEALARNIEVDILDKNDNFLRLKKGNKIEYIKQATRTAADNYISPLIMENKEVTKIILNEAGINVPNGIVVNSIKTALKNFPKFVQTDIVIKPKSTNFGEGVVILKKLESITMFENAVKAALDMDTSVIIEKFIIGREYRFLIIGDEVPAVLHRVPANVKGDGIHSIEELVIEKNKNPLRGSNYNKPLQKIKITSIEEEYLKLHGKSIKYIPKENEVVYLRENSNISTGGDSIDYTDDILEDYKIIALNAAKAVGAKICGADIIIKDIHEKPNSKNHSIIELNFNPAIHIHRFPYEGKQRLVERNILDLLGF